MAESPRTGTRKWARGSVALVAVGFCNRGPELREYSSLEAASPAIGETRTAVIVVDPAECLKCNRQLLGWLLARQGQPSSFTLLFTRQPAPPEARELALERIRADGVLSETSPSIRPPFVAVRVGPGGLRRQPIATADSLLSLMPRP